MGKNAYTTVIANPLFASFTTTASKSRVNFLKLLRAPHEEYVCGEDALIYAESQGLSLKLRARLAGAAQGGFGAGLRPAVSATDRLCGVERVAATDSREAG